MTSPGAALSTAARPPVVTRVRQPALSLRTPTLERYRVTGGGLTVVVLAAGDTLEVIDPEGLQACELMAWDAQGRTALSALGLRASPGATGTADLLQRQHPLLRPVQLGLRRRGEGRRREGWTRRSAADAGWLCARPGFVVWPDGR